MLTYDQRFPSPLEELNGIIPNRIECGETETYWIWVDRKARRIELVSKERGCVVATCAVDGAALAYGLSKRQLGAARDALRL